MDISIPLLYKILAYYTRQYNLPHIKILLDNNYDNCCVSHTFNYIHLSPIYISKGFLEKKWKERHPFAKTFEIMVITIFLHEIKHELDYLYRPKMYDMAKRKRHENVYVDINTECPLERRADKFAEREINKWI